MILSIADLYSTVIIPKCNSRHLGTEDAELEGIDVSVHPSCLLLGRVVHGQGRAFLSTSPPLSSFLLAKLDISTVGLAEVQNRADGDDSERVNIRVGSLVDVGNLLQVNCGLDIGKLINFPCVGP